MGAWSWGLATEDFSFVFSRDVELFQTFGGLWEGDGGLVAITVGCASYESRQFMRTWACLFVYRQPASSEAVH